MEHFKGSAIFQIA